MRFGTGGPDHPFADRDDESAFLGDRNEFHRRDKSMFRVMPTQKGFKANDLRRWNAYLRLVEQLEVVIVQGHTKFLRQPPAPAHRL